MGFTAYVAMKTKSGGQFGWIWWWALAFFVLAASTGVLYRFGVAYGATLGFSLGNIRHAHSHLMYFGWVTPALVVLIWNRLARRGERGAQQWFEWLMRGLFFAAAVAYLLFLLFGYSLASVGSGEMPLAVIAAGLNMLLWYGFVALYVRERRYSRVALPARTAMDAAVVFLVASTCGAWGLSLLQPLGVESPVWSSALTHIFLDLFSEGWLVLGVLGLAYAELEPAPSNASRWSLRMVCAGVPLTFALGMPSALVPAPAAALARLGGALVGAGLLLSTFVLLRTLLVKPSPRWWWGVPLAMLAVKAGAELGVSIAPGAWWASLQELRIMYLHVMLLGFVSLGLVAAAAATWGRVALARAPWLYGSVILVLASLLSLTSWWPVEWRGAWTFCFVAWVALLPVLSAVVLLWRSIPREDAEVEEEVEEFVSV